MYACFSTQEDFFIGVSITNVRLILTKVRVISAFRHKSKFEFRTFLKKFEFLGFHGVILGKTFLLMHQLLMKESVGQILTKLWLFLSSGYRQTGFWNPHMETCRHTKNLNSKLVVSRRFLYASPEDGDA